MTIWKCETNYEKIIETSDYDHFVYCIASSAIQHMQMHRVPVYYIFRNNELYNVIKGSEFDPLSRFQFEFSNLQMFYLSEKKLKEQDVSLKDKFDIMYQIIEGLYIRTEEQLEEIDTIYKEVKQYKNDSK